MIKTKSVPPKERLQTPKKGLSQSKLPYIILIILTFCIYGNSIPHDYALDDIYCISGNSFTKKGIEGIPDLFSTHYFAGFFGEKEIALAGGRYRPLSLATFALEYELFGKNPAFSHFINVLLFTFLGLLIFKILSQFLPYNSTNKWFYQFPFIATLLFLVHPIHTEVVANIKGRDEILALLFSLLALKFTFDFLKKGKKLTAFFIFLTFFLALLSKENALVFLIIIPMSIYYFQPNTPTREYFKISITLVFSAIIFLILRQNAIGGLNPADSSELMDNPFLQATTSTKYATILYTFGIYFKLLIFPHPLTWDYYPYHIPLVNFSNPIVITSIIIYLAMIFLAIAGLKKRSVISYGVLFWMISFLPVSNLLFSIGSFMAERFMFIPSLGYVIIISWLITEILPKSSLFLKYKRFVLIAVFFVFISYSLKTISRNKVWKDDFTLYTTDVITSENSAKSNNIAGQHYAYKANQTTNTDKKKIFFELAISHLKKAVVIHPNYTDALFALGNVYYDYNKNIDSTFHFYYKILDREPCEIHVFNNSMKIINGLKDMNSRIFHLSKLSENCPANYQVNLQLGQLYGEFKQNPDSSIHYMEKALKLDSTQAIPYQYLGTCYYLKNNFSLAEKMFLKSLQFDSTNTTILSYLSFTLTQLGKKEEADFYEKKINK